MPKDCGLNNEHIKSHLQKYRIHNERSQQEFLHYWNSDISSSYHEWEKRRGWEDQLELNENAHYNNSNISNGSNN